MARPYQLLASALHPTNATTSTVPDLGLLGPVPSPPRQ